MGKKELRSQAWGAKRKAFLDKREHRYGCPERSRAQSVHKASGAQGVS